MKQNFDPKDLFKFFVKNILEFQKNQILLRLTQHLVD